MADPASAAVAGPQLFSEHPVDRASGEAPFLNDAERARVSAMTDPRRRLTFVTARRLWRQGAHHFTTAHALELPAFSQLPAHGAVTPADAPFRSSLCHTDSLVLVGFNREAIGVDAEPLGRQPEWQRLARRWFAPSETEWLRTQPDPAAAFLTLWTLKEAWTKATGRGIAGNLQALTFHPEDEQLRVDRGAPQWRAATTACHGHRISVFWQGGAEPEWWHETCLRQAHWHFPEVVAQ